jgi:hypothetical protein
LLTSKKMHRRHLKTPAICWTRLDMLPSPAQQSNSKASTTTTVDGYVDGLSSLATLCFVSSKQAQRIWNQHGKAHTSSKKSSQAEHISYATPKQGQMRRTHGTSCNCATSTLRRIRLSLPPLSL